VAERISARQFLAEYAERSKMSAEALLQEGLVVAECKHCDYEGCEGWQMTTPATASAFGRDDAIVITAENYGEPDA
jgi:hypothetical protein